MVEGGQRCASHTREKLTAKAAAVEEAVNAFTGGSGDPAALRAAQDEWEQAAAEYASTDEGHAHLTAQAAAAGDMDTQALLNTVIAKGEALRAANRETAALLKAVRLAKAEPVTSAAGGLVASTGVDTTVRRMPPDESLFGRPAVVSDLSEKDRKVWAEGLAAFDEIAPLIEQIGIHHHSGYSTETAAEVRKELHELDTKIADPTLDDEEAAVLVRTATFYRGMRMTTPRWVKDEVERYDGQPLGEWRDAQHARSVEKSKQWSEFARPFEDVLIAQGQRALAHPGAGLKTFTAAQERRLAPAEELTAHPNAPMGYLRQVARKSPTNMSDEGWKRLRDSRLKDDGTTDEGVAMILAMHDPDSFHRNEAYAHVEVMDFDSVSDKQRGYLARNLHRLPGDPARQAILATSLVEWAKMSGDAQQQASMFRTLAQSKTPQAAEVGTKALAGAGIALAEPDTAVEAAAPEKKRGLFSRR